MKNILDILSRPRSSVEHQFLGTLADPDAEVITRVFCFTEQLDFEQWLQS
jgi:hypothetical protein